MTENYLVLFPPKCLWLSYGRVRSLSDDFFAYNATVVISYGLYYVYGCPQAAH